MFYVNNELVKKGTPQWDRYNEFLTTKLSKMSDPVIFKTGRPIRFNSTGLPEPNPTEWIPLQHTTYGPDGDEYWCYCERPPRKKENGTMIYSPRGKTMKNAWRFSKTKDAELIFFFSEISPFVEKGRVVLEDRRLDARKQIDKEAGELDVKYMILSEHSPISVEQTGSEDTLRMAASGWGVADVQSLSVEEVKIALLSKVQASNSLNDGRGFDEFLKEIDSRGKLVTRANIQRAVDKGIISYDDPTFTWRFTANNQPLMVVPASEAMSPQVALNNFLYINEKLSSVLEYSLGKTQPIAQPPAEESSVGYISDSIAPAEKLDMAFLRKWAKENDINSFGKKKDELVQLYKEKVSVS